MREAYNQGFTEGQRLGYMTAMESVHKAMYAACALALKEQLHFGKTRIERFLRAVDGTVWKCVNSDELVEEAFKQTGIEIDLSEVYEEDRIKAAWEEAANENREAKA